MVIIYVYTGTRANQREENSIELSYTEGEEFQLAFRAEPEINKDGGVSLDDIILSECPLRKIGNGEVTENVCD